MKNLKCNTASYVNNKNIFNICIYRKEGVTHPAPVLSPTREQDFICIPALFLNIVSIPAPSPRGSCTNKEDCHPCKQNPTIFQIVVSNKTRKVI